MISADLSGKTALVTGGASGVGLATVELLAKCGAAVALNHRANNKSAALEVERLTKLGYRVIAAPGDVGSAREAERMVAQVVEQLGRLDILVNNAGTTAVIPHHDLDAATAEVWERILRVNVLGTWHVTRAAVPHLRANGDGVILNITSIAGVRPTGSSIPYAVSKAALNHLTLLLANVLGPEIRVHAVAPGLIDTPWTEDWDALRNVVREMAPLRRSGVPEDVADACLGLVRARYSTGQVLLVDGGLALR